MYENNIEKPKRQLVLTESNVLSVYMKLRAKQDIPPEELEQVKERFFELVDGPEAES